MIKLISKKGERKWKRGKKTSSIETVIAQVKPKFKIGQTFICTSPLGDYIVSHIYLKEGVVFYKLKQRPFLFHTMSNELLDEISNLNSLINEEYLEKDWSPAKDKLIAQYVDSLRPTSYEHEEILLIDHINSVRILPSNFISAFFENVFDLFNAKSISKILYRLEKNGSITLVKGENEKILLAVSNKYFEEYLKPQILSVQ